MVPQIGDDLLSYRGRSFPLQRELNSLQGRKFGVIHSYDALASFTLYHKLFLPNSALDQNSFLPYRSMVKVDFRSKEVSLIKVEVSLIKVGADHPEFTPLERGESLDEGGSPQVGGSHRFTLGNQKSGMRSWEAEISQVGGGQEALEAVEKGRNFTSGRRSSGDRAAHKFVACGMRSRRDAWGSAS